METFPSASQAADINERVSYFIESLLVSAAPHDSAGKTRGGCLEWCTNVLQIGRGGAFQGPAKSPQAQGTMLVPTLGPSIIPSATDGGLRRARSVGLTASQSSRRPRAAEAAGVSLGSVRDPDAEDVLECLTPRQLRK